MIPPTIADAIRCDTEVGSLEFEFEDSERLKKTIVRPPRNGVEQGLLPGRRDMGAVFLLKSLPYIKTSTCIISHALGKIYIKRWVHYREEWLWET